MEGEDIEMKELSQSLAMISKNDPPHLLNEAREIIRKLRRMNLRWNIAALDEFLKARNRDIFH
ncbi:MAG: hypothetical protein WA140_03180 [Geobacteraceae bacterium]